MRSTPGFGTVSLRIAIAVTLAVTLADTALWGCGGSNPALTAGPMPESASFTGVYYSPQYGEMHLTQNGSAVVGDFTKDERSGKLQGEAQGDLLRFQWRETKAMIANRPQETSGRVLFRYMIDASNGDHVLKGRWGLKDGDSDGGEWNAYKSRTRSRESERRPGRARSREASE